MPQRHGVVVATVPSLLSQSAWRQYEESTHVKPVTVVHAVMTSPPFVLSVFVAHLHGTLSAASSQGGPWQTGTPLYEIVPNSSLSALKSPSFEQYRPVPVSHVVCSVPSGDKQTHASVLASCP